MAYLPSHGFDIEVVTLPHDWMEFQSRHEYEEHAQGAYQPTSRTDSLIQRISTTRYVNWIQRAVMVPDLLAIWARSAARQMAEQLEGIDLVYGTSPPYSGMVAAQRLADLLGVPCVQELRDPPSFHRSIRRRSPFFLRRTTCLRPNE